MTDYTKECPICGSHEIDLEMVNWNDQYTCCNCHSLWFVTSNDYELIQDNSDSLSTRNLNDPYDYYRFHRC